VKRIRLLLVEDNVIAGDAVRLALNEYGFDVRVVHAGRDAASALRRHGAEAVVLDLSLPDLHGAVVAEMLRRDWPDLPIVITTGHAKSERLDPLLANPQTAFLQKPYDIADLITLIQSRLERQAMAAARRTTHRTNSSVDERETSVRDTGRARTKRR
jgi:DNA-binding response OmpR family regulator